MRSFVAIELPADQRSAVARRVAGLRPDLPAARWVAAPNYHLTLLFLGEIDASQASSLAARLEVVFGRHQAFDLRLAGGGCFPPRRPARVVWVGVSPRRELLSLRADVARACGEALAMTPERRPYHPHLTVARCRRPWASGAARRWCEGIGGLAAEPFTVSEGVLMESRLEPTGAVYRAVARLQLAEVR